MAKLDNLFADPKPVSEPEVTYVYTGEKNYEPPKADPWVEGAIK